MSFEEKTLIVFDTNFLVIFEGRGVKYSSFEFNSSFDEIKDFINLYNLSEKVILAIPKMVIEEMKKRKLFYYKIDCISLESKFIPFANLIRTSLSLPKTDPDYKKFLQDLIDEYLKKIEIKIIEYPRNKCFQDIIRRAIEKKKSFIVTKHSSDSGFKDVVIWESILNYEKIEEYTKVIFLTNDNNAFNDECVNEFESKLKKNIIILNSKEKIFKELSKNYNIIEKEYKHLKFAKESYFRAYLDLEFSNKNFIKINDNKLKIIEYKIIDQCISLEKEEDEFNKKTGFYIINSKIAIYYNKNDIKKKFQFIAKTTIDDVNGIQNIDYDLELI